MMSSKERREWLADLRKGKTAEDIKRWYKLYPKVCLNCGAKTEPRVHVTLSGRYKGNKNTSYHCTNPKCGSEWGGYI
jgi:hypothetical protein